MRLLLLPFLALTACPPPPDDGDDTGPDVPDDYTPTWDGIVAFMEDNCVRCHAAGTPPQLSEDVFDDVSEGTGFYVVPFSPEDSVLWRVISGELEPDDFAEMPLDTGLLPPELVAHVRTWIELGAPLE